MLYHRARKICSSTEKFKSQIDRIKLFMSWNGYLLRTWNLFIKRLRNDINTIENDDKNDENRIIWVTLTYLGHIRDQIKKECFKKVQKCLTEKVYFFTRYETKTVAILCSSKGTIPTLQTQMLITV